MLLSEWIRPAPVTLCGKRLEIKGTVLENWLSKRFTQAYLPLNFEAVMKVGKGWSNFLLMPDKPGPI
jgi:hypothetical protein